MSSTSPTVEKLDFVLIATQVGEPVTLQASQALTERLLARAAQESATQPFVKAPATMLREKARSARTLTAQNAANREFLVAVLGESRTSSCWKRRTAKSDATIPATPPAPAASSAPTAHAAPPAPTLPPNSPAAKLATYRSLRGDARAEYLARHQGDIFRATADEKTLAAILKRNGDNPGPGSPIGKFLHLRTLPVGAARAEFFAKHERAIEQGANDLATAKTIAARNSITLEF